MKPCLGWCLANLSRRGGTPQVNVDTTYITRYDSTCNQNRHYARNVSNVHEHVPSGSVRTNFQWGNRAVGSITLVRINNQTVRPEIPRHVILITYRTQGAESSGHPFCNNCFHTCSIWAIYLLGQKSPLLVIFGGITGTTVAVNCLSPSMCLKR